MPSDLTTERLRIHSGSTQYVVALYPAGADPGAGGLNSPAGSIVVANDGTHWISLGGNPATFEKAALSGTVTSKFADVSGSVDGHFNQLSGTINARFANFTSSVTGTMFISSGSQANTNVATEGNMDWMTLTTSSFNPPRAQSAGGVHSRRGGGWIMESFGWVFAGQSSMTFASYTSAFQKTTNQKDTTAAATLSANTQASFMQSTLNPTSGWGFYFRVPASTQTRTLRLAHNQYSDVAVVSASLTDNSAGPLSVIHSAGSGSGIEKLTTITYNASRECWLNVSVTVLANYSNDVTCGFNWATLSGNLPLS